MAGLTSAWAMARQRPREYSRKVDAATRCSDVCPIPDQNLTMFCGTVSIYLTGNQRVLKAQGALGPPSSFLNLLTHLSMRDHCVGRTTSVRVAHWVFRTQILPFWVETKNCYYCWGPRHKNVDHDYRHDKLSIPLSIFPQNQQSTIGLRKDVPPAMIACNRHDSKRPAVLHTSCMEIILFYFQH